MCYYFDDSFCLFIQEILDFYDKSNDDSNYVLKFIDFKKYSPISLLSSWF